MGGVAIFELIGAPSSLGFPLSNRSGFAEIMFLSSLIILITGIIDDAYDLRPWQKMIGILTAANVLLFLYGH